MKLGTNKIALVTGANRGLGLETSRRLTLLGHTVILTSRDKVKGQKAVDGLSKQCYLSTRFKMLTMSRVTQSLYPLIVHQVFCRDHRYYFFLADYRFPNVFVLLYNSPNHRVNMHNGNELEHN